MSGKKTFLNWLITKFFGLAKMKPFHFRRRSLHIEALEVREMLSVVGVHSSQDAIESDQAGYVRFVRDDNQGDLTAFYQLDYRNSGCYYDTYSGWAANGKDFSYLPGSSSGYYQGFVIFNDGEYYTDLVINALADASIEGDERLELTLIMENSYWCDRTGISPNTSYTIDASSLAASLTIFDTTIPTTVWITETQDGQEGGNSGFVKLQRDNFETELIV
ncbi:MAG: hypothetical protein LBQ50_11125, partial [Planctomycetaceae bacterium]|nr:hypothetical protein [Planctomycetaceae bacterium]